VYRRSKTSDVAPGEAATKYLEPGEAPPDADASGQHRRDDAAVPAKEAQPCLRIGVDRAVGLCCEAALHLDRLVPNPYGRLGRSGLAETFKADPVTERNGDRITSKGKSLMPVLAALRDWGLARIKGTEARMKPTT
jgi:hypothetical protein